MTPLPDRSCPLCGGPNQCAPAQSGTFATPCWCRDVTIPGEVLARIPDDRRNKACVCARCAAGAAKP